MAGFRVEKEVLRNAKEKNKHMTLEDRIEIQTWTCLRSGMTFKAIARRIGKEPTAVSHRGTESALRLQWLPVCPAAIYSKDRKST